MAPSVGEVVLYNADDGKSYPAFVTPAGNPPQPTDAVDLCSFGPDNEAHYVQNVPQGTTHGTWKPRP